MTAPLRVLHLAGSATDPLLAELSRLYARDCLSATADPDRYEAMVAHVDPGGQWRLPGDRLDDAALSAAPPLPPAEALGRIAELGVDVVLPQMFCLPGMTAYRDMWAVLGTPMVGNTGAVMALGADKARTRAVVAGAGVDVPEGQLLAPGELSDVALPVVVKPVDADNSAGVSLVRHRSELPDALERAAAAGGGGVLVETYIEAGREVRCGIVERDGRLLCLPLEEYRLDPAHPVRAQADKLARPEGTDLRLMAKSRSVAWIVDPSDPVTGPVQEAARACHRALGCRDHSLFDFRIDPSGRPWFLEASLYCSFARQSVVVVMAEAAGIRLADLFAGSVATALDRGPRARSR